MREASVHENSPLKNQGQNAGQGAPGDGPYRCMPHAELRDGAYAVRAVEPGHIDAIRQWRNDQIDILRQPAPITREEQQRYFERTIWPDKQAERPRNILLIYLNEREPIGYGGLVHMDWEQERAELSFLLDPQYERPSERRADLFGRFLLLLKRLAFEDLRLNRLYTETFATRRRHMETLEQAGFRPEGCLRQHVRINGTRVDSILHGCIAGDEGERHP
ncbi:GNAT family N-acetyltransferase [Nitratireductor sp. XY-223]|uniref:GNAT family N-acetyltransferase n=1 Tax=Nitratireductor sp. XY-223 TaxID=2561926 RepID=UPI0010AAB7D0|nr:GNAT family N-acetyltransferase [Nitratireductor sp. XY-223]